MQLTELNGLLRSTACQPAFLLGQSSPVYILTTNVMRAWTAHQVSHPDSNP